VAVDSRVALWREEHRCSGSWLRASCDGMRGVATTTLDLCTRPRFLLVFPRPKCFFFCLFVKFRRNSGHGLLFSRTLTCSDFCPTILPSVVQDMLGLFLAVLLSWLFYRLINQKT
jgi:hypothetical protein